MLKERRKRVCVKRDRRRQASFGTLRQDFSRRKGEIAPRTKRKKNCAESCPHAVAAVHDETLSNVPGSCFTSHTLPPLSVGGISEAIGKSIAERRRNGRRCGKPRFISSLQNQGEKPKNQTRRQKGERKRNPRGTGRTAGVKSFDSERISIAREREMEKGGKEKKRRLCVHCCRPLHCHPTHLTRTSHRLSACSNESVFLVIFSSLFVFSQTF